MAIPAVRVGVPRRIAAVQDQGSKLSGTQPEPSRLETQRGGAGDVRGREAGAVPADQQAWIAAGAGLRGPSCEHAHAGCHQVGLAAVVAAGAGAAERGHGEVRIVAVIGPHHQRQMAGRDGADRGRHAGVVRGKTGLAAPARVVPLDPGVEPAAATDPHGGQRDCPRAGQADGVEVDDDVVVPVVGVMPAVIHPARDPAADHEVGPLAEAHRGAPRVPGRLDPHGELVRAVVPDLDLIEGDVGRVDDDAERLLLARLEGAAGVRAPPVVVACAIGDEPPGGAGQQLVERALDQRAAVPRPAQPTGADVDGTGLRPGRTGDEVHRLQQPDRVAEVGQPAGVPVGQVDEEQIGVGRDAGQAAGLPLPAAMSRVRVPWLPWPRRSAMAG